MADNLRVFVDKVFSINSTPSTVYGSALTVGVRSPAAGGSTTAAADVIYKLQGETAAMAKLVKASRNSTSEAVTKAKNIEGYLLNLQVLGQISPEFCNSLISSLHEIVSY